MSTLIKSLAGRLREFVGDRRHAPRRKARVQARLPFAVVVLDAKEESAEQVAKKKSLAGHTSDLSESGLTLLLNAMRIGGNYLTDMDHYLGIKLALPDGDVSMLAAPTRFKETDETQSESKYLLGVRIVRMQEDARSRYLAYLHSAGTSDRRARKQAQDAVRTAAASAQGAEQGNAWDHITPARVSEAFEKFLRESVHP